MVIQKGIVFMERFWHFIECKTYNARLLKHNSILKIHRFARGRAAKLACGRVARAPIGLCSCPWLQNKEQLAKWF